MKRYTTLMTLAINNDSKIVSFLAKYLEFNIRNQLDVSYKDVSVIWQENEIF